MAGTPLRFLAPFARPAVRISREIPFLIRALQPGRGRRVVFLPAYARQGAALLRIYNLAGVLRQRGWDVHVLPCRLTLAQRRRCLGVLKPDVLVMQGTRHALNRPALFPDQTILLDMDDSDFHLPHLAASVRAAMPHVAGVIAGSRYIANWCLNAGARRAHIIWTGAPVSNDPRPPQADRPPVVAWAQSRPMDYRHEAALVRSVMHRIAARTPGTTLRLYDRCAGDDPAFAQSFETAGLKVEWQERAAYRDYLSSFDDVAVGLAPLMPDDPFCRGKSFGKVLAYLDRGVPAIVSDQGEPGAFFTQETACLCQSEEDWCAGVSGLLADAGRRQQLADAGFEIFERQLSTQAAASRVAEVLGETIRTTAPLRNTYPDAPKAFSPGRA